MTLLVLSSYLLQRLAIRCCQIFPATASIHLPYRPSWNPGKVLDRFALIDLFHALVHQTSKLPGEKLAILKKSLQGEKTPTKSHFVASSLIMESEMSCEQLICMPSKLWSLFDETQLDLRDLRTRFVRTSSTLPDWRGWPRRCDRASDTIASVKRPTQCFAPWTSLATSCATAPLRTRTLSTWLLSKLVAFEGRLNRLDPKMVKTPRPGTPTHLPLTSKTSSLESPLREIHFVFSASQTIG